jgi:dienelactone hydrolase
MAGSMHDIKRDDGVDLPVYVAPDSAAGGALATKAAVIVLQEWWGLNEQIKCTPPRKSPEMALPFL